MAGDMKEIMSMIKKKVKVFSSGQMAESMREDGKTENNTVLEPTPPLVVKQNKESGKRVKDFIGFKTNETIFVFFKVFKILRINLRIFLILVDNYFSLFRGFVLVILWHL